MLLKINNLKRKIKNIHFIGIGGIGISGIAEIFIKKGYKITGSDLLENYNIKKLINLGANINIGHNYKNIKNPDIVSYTSAIDKDNIEFKYANFLNIPIFNRGEILSILTKKYYSICISGTHGKTTTTSILTDIFIKANKDPTFINGGIIKSLNLNCSLGKSKYFIVESDESDLTFNKLYPMINILTNIDNDHLNSYNNSLQELKNEFINHLNKISNNSISILCIDNKNIKDIISYLSNRYITYGFSEDSDVNISNYKQNYFCCSFILKSIKYKKINFTVNLNTIPGKHNALNATAAIIASILENIDIKCIIKTLKEFNGINRRFELLNFTLSKFPILKNKKLIFISDYGHHPNEIIETINTIKNSWNNRRLLMIFQPHRYSRTKNLFYDFVNVLINVDYLIILNIFSGWEKEIKSINSKILFDAIKKLNFKKVKFISNNDNIVNLLLEITLYKDIILIQGAGDIHNIIVNNLK